MKLLVSQREAGSAEDNGPNFNPPVIDALQFGDAEKCEARGEDCDLAARCAQAARDFDLTRREGDVLVLLAAGRTAAEVACELVVSSNTVKTHVRNLYRKLGINRRGDLAERLGL
ncbi:helix-turn-helix transcriptional regulator [Eggerthellaceae bacterium 24-137]